MVNVYKINGKEIELISGIGDENSIFLTESSLKINELIKALGEPIEEQPEPVLKKEYRYSTITGNHLGTFLADAPLEENQTRVKPEPKKEYKRWRAEEGENYWVIIHSGVSEETEGGYLIDNRMYDVGNYYQTEELAQKALDKQIALTELNDIIMEKNEGWVADLVSINEKLAINYDHLSGGFIVQVYVCVQVNPFILEIKSEEIAEYIIKNHKDLLDTIWGVESK